MAGNQTLLRMRTNAFTYEKAPLNSRVGGDESFRLQGCNLVPIGQYHEIVVPSHESPMI